MRSSTPRGFHGLRHLIQLWERQWRVLGSFVQLLGSWVQLVSLGLLGGLALLGDPFGLREKSVREIVGLPGGTV